MMIVMMVPVMGICADEKKEKKEPIYLGNDPTPHARWVRESDGYTVIYDLENLLKRDADKQEAIQKERAREKMMEAQSRQERIEL